MSEAGELKYQTILEYISLLKKLREEGVLTNKKDFTSQIGEWLVETLYDGKRAISGNEKGWDVEVNGKYIQVKTHSKDEGNSNRWSRVENHANVHIDELVIIVFSHDYKLNEFFKVPWAEAVSCIKMRGRKEPKSEINWSSIKKYSVDINTLPKQEIVVLFK